MTEFRIIKSRTEGMDGPAIADAMFRGELELCPIWPLSKRQEDSILERFLKLGAYNPNLPRTLWVLELGDSFDDVPCAKVECINHDGVSHTFTPSICEFCPRCDICDEGQLFAALNDF